MCSYLLFTFNWVKNNVMCFKKKKYTFGYLNKGDSWSCVGAEGGGLAAGERRVLTLQLLQGVGW